MGQYGEAATIATDLIVTGRETSPRAAWDTAIGQVTQSRSSRQKGCPRSTFLGLCEAGEIVGVPRGSYTKSPDNKTYAVRALEALRSTPSLANDRSALWSVATDGVEKKRNGQLDVLLTLWAAGRLRGSR